MPDPSTSDDMSDMTNCHCLCAANHRDSLGICTGKATGWLRFSNFPADSPLTGLEFVDVAMCEPCRRATLAARSVITALPPVRPGTTAHTFKAQRDEARADAERLRDHLAAYSQQAIDAEAEVERLREAGDALEDAVTDIMGGDPESVLHTWARRWREARSDITAHRPKTAIALEVREATAAHRDGRPLAFPDITALPPDA